MDAIYDTTTAARGVQELNVVATMDGVPAGTIYFALILATPALARLERSLEIGLKKLAEISKNRTEHKFSEECQIPLLDGLLTVRICGKVRIEDSEKYKQRLTRMLSRAMLDLEVDLNGELGNFVDHGFGIPVPTAVEPDDDQHFFDVVNPKQLISACVAAMNAAEPSVPASAW